MQIMLDNVGEIKAFYPSGLCDLSQFIEENGFVTIQEKNRIDCFLAPIITELKEKRGSLFYAFPAYLVEPRRELLIKIINDLP